MTVRARIAHRSGGVVMGLALTVAGLVPSTCGAPPSAPSPSVGGSWRVPAAVSLVGDSLTWANIPAYVEAFRAEHVMPAGVSGLIARSLRYGYQCRVGGRMRLRAKRIDDSCVREGLEEIRYFGSVGALGDAVVVALATNEARFFPAAAWKPHLDEVRRLVGGRPLYLVSARVATPRADAYMQRYNAAAAEWCAADVACRVIDWASAPAFATPDMFSSDGIHMTPHGTSERAAFIAREVVRLADAPVPAPAPPVVSVVAGDGSVEVYWQPPSLGEHQPVEGYVAESEGGRCTAVGSTATTCTIEGLINGSAYTVSVYGYFGAVLGERSNPVPVVPSGPPSPTVDPAG